MVIDVEALLAPVSEDNPVGEDLDGTVERYAIEEPFQIEQQAAEDEDPPIDWRDAARRIVAQLGETKDLWLGTYLMRVGAKMGDLDTVVGGAQIAAGLLQRYWNTVHPQLEMVDFIGRKAPFEALTKLRDFLNPLRRVVLVQHPRLGRYTIADIQRFASDGSGTDGYGMFQAALDDAPEGELRAVRDRLDGMVGAIREVDAILTANATDTTSTNFEPTYEALAEIRRALDAFVVDDAPAADALDLDNLDFGDLDLDSPGGTDELDLSGLEDLLGDGGSGGGDGAAGSDAQPAAAAARAAGAAGRGGARRGGGVGAITTRAEASAALEAVETYFQKSEPSSPIPTLIRRARSWIAMDFMALLQDLSPDSLNEVRKVFGVKDDSTNGY